MRWKPSEWIDMIVKMKTRECGIKKKDAEPNKMKFDSRRRFLSRI